MSTSRIPLFYRVLFKYIDPPMPLFGLVAYTSYPSFILSGFVSSPILPPAPETTLLLYAMAGFYGALMSLQILLLHFAHPNDVRTWKILQGATVFVDVGMVAGFLKALDGQGRWWDLTRWRGDEMNQIVGNAVLGLIRLAFVLGVGLKKSEVKKE
ncbi:hypothetical protein MNV49_001341 [Pseudohyphozyma bogoriensis]|nr:hypothetical protein MNV49_001341 [Pseudohyphozyma bogoriensis]